MKEKLPYRITGLLILIIEAVTINYNFNGTGTVDLFQGFAYCVIVYAVTLFALLLIVG